MYWLVVELSAGEVISSVRCSGGYVNDVDTSDTGDRALESTSRVVRVYLACLIH